MGDEQKNKSNPLANAFLGAIALGVASVFLALCAWVVVWLWSSMKGML